MNDSPFVIRAEGVTKIYRRGQEQIHALRGVDLCLEEGAFAAIMGPSGGGKSTLLHLLGGIDAPSAGRLWVCGAALHQAGETERTRLRREQVGFIFQFYNLMPSLSALDNAALPLLARGEPWGAARQRAQECLAAVGLAQRLRHRPGELSGGEQQRVAIARALAGRPRLILADEPTGDLDSAAAQQVIGALLELNQRQSISLLVATHNPAVADAAGRVFELRDGRLAERGGAP